jgi:acetate kinase
MKLGSLLTLNAGSSSLKFALFSRGAPPTLVTRGAIGHMGPSSDEAARALATALDGLAAHGGLASLAAVGHRIVHGGASFAAPVRIDAAVLAELRRLAPLDPDHLPAEIAILEAVQRLAPALDQVACFDTAFHAAMPRASKLLPLARRYEAQGLRRYGFHGLSYTYLLAELARVAGPEAARARVILAHLGSGASLAALLHGACVDTTMAFTPNSGFPMGTRTGDLDPGVVLHLLRTEHRDADALDALLSKESGLLGVSGTSADMRDLLAREPADPAAADAVELFVRGVHKAIGALVTTIGGLDTLVFSGGIGEHAAPVRARICAALAHLGVELDPARNESHAPVISSDASARIVRVIPTDEEAVIARETMRVLSGGGT